MITLDTLSIDPVDIGSQGNAVLGIRGSGKTYTATLLAERLHDAGIPFIAFDPIGVWRFLRVPGAGKGYPVVVAGGQDGDLPLTVASAPEIVRAAMASGVSLVIDLFDINLSKADWKRIVTACVRVLLHENSTHGLRHVFIEEAAEFAPQKVGPDQGHVYAEIEKLARMGGNSRLGYTLINQRAEEVNKAVLELCDNLFLHRQKGRNSLTALSKWLDIGNADNAKQIVASMATLPTGQCWAWMGESSAPVLITVPAKNSFHPDRTIMRGDVAIKSKKAVDVGSFVQAMKAGLETFQALADANDPTKLRARIAELERERAIERAHPLIDATAVEAARKDGYQRGAADGWLSGYGEATKKVLDLAAVLATDIGAQPPRVVDEVQTPYTAVDFKPEGGVRTVPSKVRTAAKPAENVADAASRESLTPAKRKILIALRQLQAIGIDAPDKVAVAWFADASPKSSGYSNNLGALRTAGLIDYPSPGCVAITVAGAREQDPVPAATHEDIMDIVRPKLGPAMFRMLVEVASQYPDDIGSNELAAAIGASPSSSGFSNNKGRLRSLGLVTYPSPGRIRAADLLYPGL